MQAQRTFLDRKSRFIFADIHYQYHGYFGLLGIGNIGNIALPDPLVVSNIQKINGDPQQVKNVYDRMFSYMIAKAIGG